jgi:hypothetical protein
MWICIDFDDCLTLWSIWDCLESNGEDRKAFLQSVDPQLVEQWDDRSKQYLMEMQAGRTMHNHPDYPDSTYWSDGDGTSSTCQYRIASCHSLLAQFIGPLGLSKTFLATLQEEGVPVYVRALYNHTVDTRAIMCVMGVCSLVNEETSHMMQCDRIQVGGEYVQHSDGWYVPIDRENGGLDVMTKCLIGAVANSGQTVPFPLLSIRMHYDLCHLLAADAEISSIENIMSVLWILISRIPQWSSFPSHPLCVTAGNFDHTSRWCFEILHYAMICGHHLISQEDASDVKPHGDWLKHIISLLLNHVAFHTDRDQLRLLWDTIHMVLPNGSFRSRNHRTIRPVYM